MKRKILLGLAATAAAFGLTFGAGIAPASALTQYVTVNCSMYDSNRNTVRVLNFTTGYITIKAYSATGALISTKTSNASTVWGYGNRSSYTRFVVTGASFSATGRCS